VCSSASSTGHEGGQPAGQAESKDQEGGRGRHLKNISKKQDELTAKIEKVEGDVKNISQKQDEMIEREKCCIHTAS
jgi:hypothetical protein